MCWELMFIIDMSVGGGVGWKMEFGFGADVTPLLLLGCKLDNLILFMCLFLDCIIRNPEFLLVDPQCQGDCCAENYQPLP